MDTAFGHWLAGFIDGEGCFQISPMVNGGATWTSFRLIFDLTLRADDEAILREIHRETGLGHVNRHSRVGTRTERAGWNDYAGWHIRSRKDVAGLCVLLDQFPLRAKKAVDYAIWRRAATCWLETVRHGGSYAGSRQDRNRVAWQQIGQFRKALDAVRLYDSNLTVEEVLSEIDELHPVLSVRFQ